MSAKDQAKNDINKWAALGDLSRSWTHLSRAKVAAGALARIDNPDLIDQGDANLCGPSCFVRALATDAPVEYASVIIQLYTFGKANFMIHSKSFWLKPGGELKSYKLPASALIDEADWMILASVRDSENFFFNYSSVDDQVSAPTTPGELAGWFKRAGYTDVKESASVKSRKDRANATEASRLFSQGYKVSLLINDNVFKSGREHQGTGGIVDYLPNHWVALSSPITFNQNLVTKPAHKDCYWEGRHRSCVNVAERTYADLDTSSVAMKVYTWGKVQNLPESGTLSFRAFHFNYYGYVACRF